MPEAFRMLRKPPLDPIGHERRQDMRGPGNQSDQKADHCAAPDRTDRCARLRARRQQVGEPRLRQRPHRAAAIGEHQLGDAEQADRERHHAEPVGELGDAAREAVVAAHRVDPDHAEQQPERRHGQRLRHRAAAHVGEHQHAHEEEREILGRSECQRQHRQRRRQQHQGDEAERAGDERADGGDGERGAGTTLAGHLVAVDAGDHGGRLARNAHQDRRGGAAIHGAVVDAGEQDDGGGRRQPEADRQQDADASKGAEAGEHTDDRAHQAAEERIGEHGRRQRHLKAEHQIVQRLPHAGAVKSRTARSAAESSRRARTAQSCRMTGRSSRAGR